MPTTTKNTQPSRSAEARKARRVIREALRLGMILADSEQAEIHEASQTRLDDIQEELDQALHVMNVYRQNRELKLEKAPSKVKAEKTPAKTKRIKKAA